MTYCKRCGANLKPAASQAVVSRARSGGAAWAVPAAVAAITLGGFALIFALVMVLVTRGIKLEEGWLVLIISSLLAILAIDWLLIRQLPGLLLGRTPATEEGGQPAEKRSLSEKPAPQLAAARREPASSVTEHTTRTFDLVYRERDTQR
jgi:hypothetical protein